MPDIIVRATKLSAQRLAAARRRHPEPEIRARALESAPPPVLSLDGGFDLIAEIKLASPSAGTLRPEPSGPGAFRSEASDPGAPRSEASTPGTLRSEASDPGAPRSEASTPGTLRSEASTPGTPRPVASSPSTLRLGAADPGAHAGSRIVEHLASCYASAGAAAISVLTEPEYFKGSLQHLEAAARISSVPVMRKDFLVDPYQIFEARAAGAGGVLLILRSTRSSLLTEMLDAAAEAGLFVLLEAFDGAELDRAVKLLAGRERQRPQILVGVNTRDLETLEVDPARLARLAPRLPAAFPGVAESGLKQPEDAAAAAALGYRVALVGSALVRSPNPAHLLAAMLRAGRERISS